jgi:hypothetical protein
MFAPKGFQDLFAHRKRRIGAKRSRWHRSARRHETNFAPQVYTPRWRKAVGVFQAAWNATANFARFVYGWLGETNNATIVTIVLGVLAVWAGFAVATRERRRAKAEQRARRPKLMCGLKPYKATGHGGMHADDLVEQLTVSKGDRFSITVENRGKTSACDVSIRLNLPAGFIPLERDLPHDVNPVTHASVILAKTDIINPQAIRNVWIDVFDSAARGGLPVDVAVSMRDCPPRLFGFLVTVK